MEKKKLLLHACCAPCTSGVLWQLEDYDLSCFYYNPNISPEKEYKFREEELERFLKNFNIPLYSIPILYSGRKMHFPGGYTLRIPAAGKTAVLCRQPRKTDYRTAQI